MSSRKAVCLLFEAGTKLGAKSETVASAVIYFHKFRREMGQECHSYDPFLIAATCIYLAGKAEEDHIKIRDIINVFYAMLHSDSEPLHNDSTYWALRDSIVQCELLLLRILRFKVANEHPHRYLLHYLKSLVEWIGDEKKGQLLSETCWALLNDFYLDHRVITHLPHHIAIAIIELGLQCHSISVPYNEEAVLGWDEALCESLTKEETWQIIDEVISIYEQEPRVMKPGYGVSQGTEASGKAAHSIDIGSSRETNSRQIDTSEFGRKSYKPQQVIDYQARSAF